MKLTAQEAIALINEITTAATNVTAKIIAASELTEEDLRRERDNLSAETHAIIQAELAKLPPLV